jgi:hypothetical protein
MASYHIQEILADSSGFCLFVFLRVLTFSQFPKLPAHMIAFAALEVRKLMMDKSFLPISLKLSPHIPLGAKTRRDHQPIGFMSAVVKEGLKNHANLSGHFSIGGEDQIKQIVDCKFARSHHSGSSISLVLKNERF